MDSYSPTSSVSGASTTWKIRTAKKFLVIFSISPKHHLPRTLRTFSIDHTLGRTQRFSFLTSAIPTDIVVLFLPRCCPVCIETQFDIAFSAVFTCRAFWLMESSVESGLSRSTPIATSFFPSKFVLTKYADSSILSFQSRIIETLDVLNFVTRRTMFHRTFLQ